MEKLPVQTELALNEPVTEKTIYVKLTPGTDLYIKVCRVADIASVTPTLAARMMMRNGWLGFRRFLTEEGFEVKK